MKQKTIKSPLSLSGVGIHSGEETKIIIHPTKADTGIVFIYQKETIPLSIKKVIGDRLATTLGPIVLVEHLLAAFSGLRINNVSIECFSKEIPILDGSSLPLIEALERVGIVELKQEVSPLVLTKTIRVEEEDKWITAEPAQNLSVEFMVNYPVIGHQQYIFDGSLESFKKDIAPARTFGYEKDLEELHKKGFAKGASLENALAIGENGYINQPRFKDEPVRHKILDVIGDLALLGRPLNAKIKGYKSSHRMNHELVRRILNA